MTDVTNQIKFNEAQQNIELLNTLQASVSHDMKAPLCAMTSTIEIVIK
jgi:K+-sensing histidine kinase KdpD